MKKNKIIAILVIIFISIAKTMTAFNADSTKMTNIVIFISFKDSETPAWDRFLWEQWFEDPAVWWNIKGYFNAVSYGKLELNNYFYPTVTDKTDPNTIIYYADTNPIAYYQPLSDSNPIGYTISDRSDREVGLYKRAIDFVQTNTPIDVGIELDGDNDGEVDNVYFICNSESNKPTYSGILWGHQPTLRPYYDLSINGKKVNKVCMGALHASIGGTTHELFHVLGFPELYHYQKYSDTNKYNIAAGYWDPMGEANAIVHPSAYMKYRYGKWIDSIPLISTAGTYTLNKIIEPNNNCYKITSPISEKEYFV